MSALVWFVPLRSRADAEVPRVALAWKPPPGSGCATQDEIQAEVARLSERPLITRDPRFEIEALALFHEGSWVASVALRDAQGSILGGREVSGPYVSCRDLDVPVALVVATLLDGLREREEPKPEPVVAAAPAPAPEPEQAAPLPAWREGKVGVGAFVAGAWGLAPPLALGGGVQVELPLAWPLVFEASAYLPGKKVDDDGRGVRAFGFHAGVALCPRLFGRRHELRLCGGAQVGAVSAHGVDLTTSKRSTQPLLLLGLEPKFVLGVTSSWALQLGFGAHWVAIHPRFHWEIEGAGEGRLETRAFALLMRIGVIDFLR